MNQSHSNVHFYPTASSQVPVVRFEDMNNSQIVPLHILENDFSQELLIPHVSLIECTPLPLATCNTTHTHIGSEKEVRCVKSQVIPVSNETRTKTFSQFYMHKTEPGSSTPKTKEINIFNEATKSLNYATETVILNPINYSYKTQSDKLDDAQIKAQSSCISKLAVQQNKDSGTSKVDQPIKVKRTVQNYVHISDVRVPQRAIAVLPTALQIRGKNDIFPRRTLPARIRFGPVEGTNKVVSPSQADSLVSVAEGPIFLLKKDDQTVHIDVSDTDKCNWMGLLPLGKPGDANVWLYQENTELYAITTEPINARGPLKLGYSKKYAEEHSLPIGIPILDLETVLSSNPKQWWCNECNRALPSATLLQRHSDVYHKDDIISTRRGYRCLKCRRMFSRLFTLRRHISKHCTARTEKPKQTEQSSSLELNSTLTNEDNRVPSDESFQNFTNGLDFSTNLFDTDRISNLDISSNSRADDFNPYDITFRDDTCTSNDLSFSKLTGPSNISKETKLPLKTTLDPCTYCGQVITKGNRRKHVSECTARKLECGCGMSFRNKIKLAQHILQEHPPDSVSNTDHISPEKKNYTCEQCSSKRFKRRGMLVNHLWRAHKIVSTCKVERPVRHYPCVACAKIYRSAAKRDRHILVHHPGAEKLAVQSIAGGVKSCEPALCPHCPRQYATRAKLLQHVRAQHKSITLFKISTPCRAKSIAGGVKSCEPALCPHCPRQYATRAKLLQHVRAQHKTENTQAPSCKEISTAS